MEKKRAIIFGGLGFVGAKIAEKLCLKNYKVDVVDTKKDRQFCNALKKKFGSNIQIKIFDITKTNLFNKIGKNNYQLIFDCAAYLGVNRIIQKSFESLKNNIECTFNISSFAKKQKNLKKIIYMSSSEIYDGSLKKKIINPPNVENSILSVSDIYHPRTVYMLSKLTGEIIYINSKLPFLNLRLHNIFGPRMYYDHGIPTFIRKLKNNKIIKFFNKNHIRSYLYIDDAMDQIIKLTFSKEAVFSAYNIGSDKNVYTNYHIASLIKKLMKSNSKILFENDKKNSINYRKPSLNKLKKIIKIKKSINFEDQLKKTINYFELVNEK